MSLTTRLKTGLVLTKDSILVIRNHPKLLLFPAISGVTGVAFLVLFLGITFGLLQVTPEGGVLIGLLVAYFVLTFVSTFFTAALVHQTRAVFDGKPVSIRDGVAGAWEVKGPIAVWSLIAATVGVLINMLENSDSSAARLLGTLFGLAWTILTFFVVPVIVFERPTVSDMFTRSGSLFKDTWGETPISLIAINIIGFIVMVPFALIGGALLFSAATAVIVLGIAIILTGALVSFLISQTLQGVVKTSLYVYAVEGKTPDEFADVEFETLPTEQDRGGSPGSAGGPRTGDVR